MHVFVGPLTYNPAAWAGQGLRGWMGECLQDYHAMRALGFPRGSFFVDLAAHDALLYSNTAALEAHFGWTASASSPWGGSGGPRPALLATYIPRRSI